MARLRSRPGDGDGLREHLIDRCTESRESDETWEASWHPYRRRLEALESGGEVELIADWELDGRVLFTPSVPRWYRLTADDALIEMTLPESGDREMGRLA